MLSSDLLLSTPQLTQPCADDPLWDNHSGRRCADYVREGWCKAGGLAITWTGGAQFNFPERACCACGKAAALAASVPTAAKPAVPQAAASPPPVSAFTPTTGGGAPRDAALAALLDALPASERDAVQTRLSTCAATHAAPRAAAETLLYVPRLPRTGNGLMCRLLSACSARQARAACGASVALSDVASARSAGCPSGASPFAFYGNEKLPPTSYGCASGINASASACQSFGGDAAGACQFLGTMRPPGAVMIASERFPDFAVPPCPLVRPAVRLLALLRDPGERAQSAFSFNYEACVCNFRYPWCTMFTSFRFKNRQSKLCDEHTPRHGFASALSELRSHGNMPWSVTSSEMPHVLGRFTAGVVREVYAPYFGGYRAAEGGPWKSSALLARATLARCFAWVGIAEELPTSLRLLKHEMPELFGKLDVSQFPWTPSSGSAAAGDPLAANQSQHPYLRSHLLTRDYDIYDAERKRLLQRARRAGIVVETPTRIDFY